MYASIDSLIDKLDRQILKHKEKNLERRNQGSLKTQDFNQPE
jgi:putative sigma-54 modulation protein